MLDLVVSGRKDARFMLAGCDAEVILGQLLAANTAAKGSSLKLLIIVAHPDDEAIGAGALVARYPGAVIAHLTDGGGRGESSARTHGFASRADYASARRAEVIAALKLAGVSKRCVRCLGIPDGDACRRLVESCQAVMSLLDDVQPDIVLTHPYEGGHTDHDTTAFAVHLAVGVLRREGGRAPLILELTSYHDAPGQRVRGQFIPFRGVSEKTLLLDEHQSALKRSMFAAFETQRDILAHFSVNEERFRVAPRYQFTKPPHTGPLGYERHCVSVTGEEWRAMAAKALEVLRARQR